jgi:hypothetical protein
LTGISGVSFARASKGLVRVLVAGHSIPVIGRLSPRSFWSGGRWLVRWRERSAVRVALNAVRMYARRCARPARADARLPFVSGNHHHLIGCPPHAALLTGLPRGPLRKHETSSPSS